MDYKTLIESYFKMEKNIMCQKCNTSNVLNKPTISIEDCMKEILEKEKENKDKVHFRMNYDTLRLWQVQRMSDEDFAILNEIKNTHNTFYNNK